MRLPVQIGFGANQDGWTLDRADDRVCGIRAFPDDSELVVEIEGTTTVVSPAAKQYRAVPFVRP